MPLNYPRPIVSGPSDPSAAVIFLHGLGDTGDGWSDIGAQVGLICMASTPPEREELWAHRRGQHGHLSHFIPEQGWVASHC